ncbi:hypothetical protein LAZ67_3000868, partial [Cordylochernes scorpioides]
MADKIQEMNPRLQVYETKNKDPTFEEMTATIASLKEKIATLKLENRTRQNRRSNSPRPRQRSRSGSDRYPIPKLEDFNHILRKTRYYSKIDLFKAYYQIPINEEDREKTAVITPFGLFEFEVMSFGLCGAPATFQRFINQVLWGLDFVFPYLDDILVASKSEEEHESHLRAVFSRLDQYGLRINQAKTVLNVNNVEFLGYWITPEGIRPTESKVQAIVDYKKPETVQDLRRFLSMLNFYRRFLKNAAEDQAILNDFLKGSKKNDKRSIPWTEEAEQKFIKCKTELSKAALLTFPDPECPLALFTDASDRAMGAVLQHFIDGAWKPIAFFSKKLSESLTKYSTYDRELLVIFSAIKHFKFFLEGRDFIIFTDQEPLIYAFQQNLEKASHRQVRQLQYISQFTTSIRHVSGKDNMVADTLSRISEIISVDYDIIAEKQKDDTELSNLRSQNKSLIFKEHRLPSGKNLWNRTKGCINCQKSKITRHTKTEYGEFGKPDERFGTVHIDLIGPLPPLEGKTYCLTLIDSFTNWVEVLPLEDIKADTIIKSFYKEWISRYGAPCHLITDRGMQFMSQKLKEFAKMCGIQLKHTTSYHPQSNGKIERFHRTLKATISSHNYIRWTERLPSVLLGLRSSIYGSSDFSIAQMVFGKTIRLPGEFFQDSQQSIDRDDLIKTLQKDMSSLQPMKSRINQNPNVFIHKDLQSCSHWLKTIKNPSGRLFRWSLRLSSYEYEVRYVKGKQQYEADLLSRNPFCGFLDASLIKTHQPSPSGESSLTIDRNGLHTVSRKGVIKIIIPKTLVQQLLQTVHAQYNHPGISQMSRLISAQYYWQGMSKDIKQKVKTCPTCQLTKRPLGPTYGELSQPPEAKEPFDLLSLDTKAGFAKYGNTKIYLHVVVDHFSRYAWTFPSKSTSITTYQQVLKRVLQDGSPKRLLTDRAPAFTSPKFSSFLLNRNIHPLLTTSNNPQANGLCERLNATLTGKLRLLHLENPKIAWTKLVKRVTIIYNSTPHSTTGFPPIYLMFGVLPPELSDYSTPYPDIDRARKIAHTRTQNKHIQDKNIYDQRHKQPHFEIGDLVLFKLYHHPNTGKLAPYFTGPHTILEIISPNVVRIDRPNQPLQRDTDTIYVNKLKLYTEKVRYISPPAIRIHHVRHKPDYTFPFKHFTPELFPAEPLRFKPTNSEPFKHLDPTNFSKKRFTPFSPDNKKCELEQQQLINKVQIDILEPRFIAQTWEKMAQAIATAYKAAAKYVAEMKLEQPLEEVNAIGGTMKKQRDENNLKGVFDAGRRIIDQIIDSIEEKGATSVRKLDILLDSVWSSMENAGFNYSVAVEYFKHPLISLGMMETTCRFCGALRWKDESSGMCCSNGKVRLPLIDLPPEPLRSLLSGENSDSVHFLRNIRKYNSCFQMTSFGAENQTHSVTFPTTFSIQGQVYHRIGSLMPSENQPSRFLQIYFMGKDDDDDDIQTDRRCQQIQGVRRNIVQALQRMLRQHNLLVQQFKTALENLPSDAYRVVVNADRTPPGQHPRRYNAPTANEVAVVLADNQFGLRDIVLHQRDNLQQHVSDTHRFYDALQYPLIFWKGQEGYSFHIPQIDPNTRQPLSSKVSSMDFYGYFIMVRRNSPNVIVQFGQLFHQFLVDMYAKVESERLRYITLHQRNLRAESYIHLRDALSTDANINPNSLGQRIILPSSFVNSSRYLAEYTQDAFCYVRKFGRPDLFITFTSNPSWKELSAALLPGQKQLDRHDITARVFRQKLVKFIGALTKGQLYGATVAWMYSVEWQKRGLPHAHILVWLANKLRPTQIDSVICAEFPDPIQDPRLYNIVVKNMIHGPC